MRARLLRPGAVALALGLGLGPAGAAPQDRAPGSVVRVEHRDPDTAPSRGPASAPVTIEFFFQPNTNAGTRLPSYKALERLQASHPMRIRVIYRVMKRGAQVQLPTAVLEAHAQGKFFELMEELHGNRTTTSLGRPEVLELARKIGIDVPRLAAAISNDRYRDALEANDRRQERLMRGQASLPTALFNTRPPRSSLAAMSDGEYEREYTEAYERAMELIDRGVDQRHLMEAFDALVLRGAQPFVISTGPTDDDVGGDATDHRLASPPLALAGLPSFGKPDAPRAGAGRHPVPAERQPVRELPARRSAGSRRPTPTTSASCGRRGSTSRRDDAADLTLLGDAALCAEQVGSSPDDLSASPGWRWIDKQLQRASRSHGRRSPAEKLIDDVTAEARHRPAEAVGLPRAAGERHPRLDRPHAPLGRHARRRPS